MAVRMGIGHDMHRLAEGTPLVLGGVRIESPKGSVGHSDGDVISHAAVDALLGAAHLGDIGRHFPSTDDRWKGVSSLLFLQKTAELVRGNGWEIDYLDITLILESPQISPFVSRMEETIALALGIGSDRVSVKATTPDGVDAVGRGEAVAAMAVATVSTRT